MYYSYIIYMLPAFILTMIAQLFISSSYKKYSTVLTKKGITGVDAARRILDENGCTGVRIEPVQGKLSDHYDPKANVIRLSEGVYGSSSVAALGVAAHEAGHAVQYAKNYFPVKIRTAIYPACAMGSRMAMYLLLIGAFAAIPALYYAGIAAFLLAALFQLITLPVELNASRRAMAALNGFLSPEELSGARKVLSAAALTYVAALFTSFMQLVYLLSRTSGRRR